MCCRVACTGEASLCFSNTPNAFDVRSHAMPLPPIQQLSDSDDGGPQPAVASSSRGSPQVKRSSQGDAVVSAEQAVPHRTSVKIGRLLQLRCKCSQACKRKRESCFKRFLQLADRVGKLRQRLASLHKLDSDREVGTYLFSGAHVLVTKFI